MNMLSIIISYPSLGFFIVSTLVYIVCRRHYYFIYDHRLLFVVGLMFSRSLTYYAIVEMLMWYLTDHEVSFVRSTVLSNIQESLSSLFVIFMAHSADSFVGRFRTLLFSTTAFISGVMLLLIFNPYDVTWLIVILVVLLALGKSGDRLLENILTDLVNEVDKSEGRNKKRSHARATIWRRVAHVSGAISATMWVAPYSLGSTHTSWNFAFLVCLISLTVTLMIFCKGHSVYHQGELIHRPIQIFFRVVRARLQKLLRSKSRCSTQERSLERKPGNEGSQQEHGDNCYKEDVKWTRFRRNQKLQIGVGVLCSFLSCVFAWQLEVNRVKELRNLGSGVNEYIETSISFLWLVDKQVQNYGEEYMEIVWCLGQLVNTSLMLTLRRQLGWFNEGTNDETRLDMYYLVLVCVCSVNLIIYTCVAIWFYKDKKQDHNSSHDLHQHD
ncbi:putative proton-dependent oligopeptide transporter family, MFS transporter superfamily [Helianthus annuus]|nr:putative proton-dependent oligopeptide transporter family, MFS transporter superfamily [Helianthus annuus]KAJ0529087.1 putative proton-dependent oligopeptide transporter family, MFS transporter superfamily [Helianthus annuus]